MGKKEKLPPVPAHRPGRRSQRNSQVQASAPAADTPPSLDHIAEALRPLARPLSELAFMVGNAVKHPEKQLAEITGSLRQFGQVEALIVNRRPTPPVVIGGNGRLASMLAIGWTHGAVVDVDLSPAKANALSLALNRTADGRDWDKDAVDKLLRDLDTGNDEALDAMLAELATDLHLVPANGTGVDAADDPGPQIDRAAELQAQWKTATGQLWIIPSKSGTGGHRLLCGDSTKAEDVARVMGGEKAGLVLTDPPYGVDFKRGQFITDPSRRSGLARGVRNEIENDSYKAESQQEFMRAVFSLAKDHCNPAASVYMFSASLQPGAHSMLGLAAAGVHIQSQLVWVKNNLVLGIADYQWKHEVCWYGWYEGASRRWFGERNKTTVLEFDRLVGTIHPNEKPLPLIAHMIENSSEAGDIMYEPFAGSGTAIAAAEQTKRTCRAVELSPAYVAVALQRLADMGLEPRLAS